MFNGRIALTECSTDSNNFGGKGVCKYIHN
jgi:hypothetical protein